MEVTLTINGLDVHKTLSTYDVTKEISYRKVITTLDGVEHPYPAARKTILSFSLFPMTDSESTSLYDALSSALCTVIFTNPHSSMNETRTMRITSNLESVFALLSVDGKRRYKGGTIQLREL